MRRILLPLEQTERSLKALQYFRKHYSPEEAAVVLLMVDESLGYSVKQEEEEAAINALEQKLALIKDFLKGYEVFTRAEIGKAGQRIVKCAREYGVSLICMTKSSKEDMLNQIGRTTEYVLINSPCNVCIVCETRDSSEYKGLVYTKAQSVVNLRGQIGDKQSECLLPSVTADCNYHIEVTVGKVRFYHTTYNIDTGNWDLPPSSDQRASVDISAGEKADILVRAGKNNGKTDRIRIVNRGIKQEAVFNYLITPIEEIKVEEEIVEEEPVPKFNKLEQRATFEWVDVVVPEEAPEQINQSASVDEYAPEPFAPENAYIAEDAAPVEIAEEIEEKKEDSHYVKAFRSAWDTQVYFDDIYSARTDTNILEEYLNDWKLCAEDSVAYVPDSVISETETEISL